jgi:hypothetical protein
MKKLLLFAVLALAALSLCLAEEFGGLAFEAELDGAAMAAIDGQMIAIVVPFNSSKGNATVITRERGDYCQYTVPVTTLASACNPKNPPINDKKEYTPTPLPKGNYDLGSTKTMSNANYGIGIAIQATVTTPYVGGGSFQACDYFIHSTSSGNTWGCVGIQGGTGTNANMTKIINSLATSTGSKILSVR